MSFLGTLGGLLGTAGGIAGLIPGIGSAVGGGLGAIGGALSGADDKSKAGQLSDQALAMQTQNWNANQPLRDRARSTLLAGIPKYTDLGGIYQDSGNPYARAPGSVHSILANRPPIGGIPSATNQAAPPPSVWSGLPPQMQTTLARVNPGLASRLQQGGQG